MGPNAKGLDVEGIACMTNYRRFALYAMADGALHDKASRWLGWDASIGMAVVQPTFDDLPAPIAELTAAPRAYGFHGTMKPPFRLANGQSQAALQESCAAILPSLQAATVARMVVRPLGGFVALVPTEPSKSLNRLSNQVVKRFEAFREPLNEAELAKRRRNGLTERQERFLQQWGYPYVMEEFRFHMTLTGKLPPQEAAAVAACLQDYFAPVIPTPFPINAIALLGEDAHGRFHVIQSYPLGD